MAPLTIHTRLDADALGRPEFQPFLGREVEIVIRVRDVADPPDDLTDHEYLAQLEAELATDPRPELTLEEVQALLATDPGNWGAEIAADREERF